MRLSKYLILVSALAAFGCAGSTVTPIPSSTTAALRAAAAEPGASAQTENVASLEEALGTLPQAPWADGLVASADAPEAVLTAWSTAENRDECAPLTLESAAGLPRVSAMIDGGWAVEYDQHGAPGMSRSGQRCTRCGRGAFGVAGTAMSPETLDGFDAEHDAMAPTFSDGSSVTVESEGSSVAAATITVQGQHCVYQVWSFLGEDHLNELVGQLRVVEVEAPSHLATR